MVPEVHQNAHCYTVKNLLYAATCVLGNNTTLYVQFITLAAQQCMVDSYMNCKNKTKQKKLNGGGHLQRSTWALAWDNMVFTVLWSSWGRGYVKESTTYPSRV